MVAGNSGSRVRINIKNDNAIKTRPSQAIKSLAVSERRKRPILLWDQRRQLARIDSAISHRPIRVALQHRRRNCPTGNSLTPLPPNVTLSRHRFIGFRLADRPGVERQFESCRQILAALKSFLQKLCHLLGRLFARSQNSKRRIRSEEHTSELQSLTNLVCRLLLEK